MYAYAYIYCDSVRCMWARDLSSAPTLTHLSYNLLYKVSKILFKEGLCNDLCGQEKLVFLTHMMLLCVWACTYVCMYVCKFSVLMQRQLIHHKIVPYCILAQHYTFTVTRTTLFIWIERILEVMLYNV